MQSDCHSRIQSDMDRHRWTPVYDYLTTHSQRRRSRGFLLGLLAGGGARAGCQVRGLGPDVAGKGSLAVRRIYLYVNCTKMDSEVQRDGRILDLIDDAWREDKLPYEDVAIPLNELPEPEQDNGGTTESVKEQEMKWTDLALQYLHENVPPTGN
ncbi:unnamed protein product [Caretta caretta]